MEEKDKTREKLIIELAKLRQHIIKLEKSETENKRAAKAIQESEKKFRSIAECSPNMIFINSKGRVVYANKRCEELTDYKRKEFYSPDFDFHMLIAKESQDLIKTNYKKHLNGEEVLPYEYTIITKKGRRIEAIINTKLINYQGERAILGIITDITERKKTEEALKESEERYRDLVEKADIAITIDDREGNFRYFNKKFAELFGYSEKAMRKKSIQTLVHPDDARWVMEFHKARFHGGKIPSRYEFKGVRKDGSTIYLEADVVELKEEESTIGTRAYIWDITERKMAEKELLESEEKFRSLVANSSDAIISVNAQGIIDFWNPAAKDVFGYSSEEVIGKPYEIILHKRFHTVFKKTLKQIVLWKRLGIIENRTEMIGLRKDGQKFPMEVSISSWMTKEGIFFSSSIRDITEQKKAKDEPKKEFDDLKDPARVNSK